MTEGEAAAATRRASRAAPPTVALFFTAVALIILTVAGVWSLRELQHDRALRADLNEGFEARARLAGLAQPFTLSQARQAWGTSRRVAVPLAEWLDARGVTERLPDATRRLR